MDVITFNRELPEFYYTLSATECEGISSLAYENVGVAICVFDAAGRFVKANHAYSRLCGWGEVDLLGQSYSLTITENEDSIATLLNAPYLEGQADQPLTGEGIVLCKDMGIIDVYTTATLITRRGGQSMVVMSLSDITIRKQHERKLLYLSRHDHLTGLPNRLAFEEQLAQVIAVSPAERSGALLFIDLDGFKRINDTAPKGHAAGDQALLEVADNLQSTLRATDLLARLGGDEFAVLLPHTPLAIAEQVAERLRQSVLVEPFLTDGCSFPLSLSIGLVAIAGQAAEHTVIREADTAMYLAKRQGGNRVIVFDNAMG